MSDREMELLEALENLVRFTSSINGIMWRSDDMDPMKAARAVIAKARSMETADEQ